MNEYLVVYRSDADFANSKQSAHRVEGWNKDYAFFGHPDHLDEVTRLIPRELVTSVSMVKCHRDEVEFSGEERNTLRRTGS